MRKTTAIGITGIVMVVSGFVGTSNASDEVVVARLVIESAGDVDAGYGGPARGIDIKQFVNEAMSQDTVPVLEPETSGMIPVPSADPITGPVPEEKVASAAMAMPIVPNFSSTKSVTSAVAPAIDTAPAKRRVTRTSASPERRRISVPIPITMGVFR